MSRKRQVVIMRRANQRHTSMVLSHPTRERETAEQRLRILGIIEAASSASASLISRS